MVYADNAATTNISDAALEAMSAFLRAEYANASQPYSFARVSKTWLRKARVTIAECIGAEPNEIFFTSGGSESDNWVIADAAKQRRNIITTMIEHHAVLNSCAEAERNGSEVVYLAPDKQGLISPDSLASITLKENTLVSVMTANNEIGTIQPIVQLAKTAHSANAVFHTDAVQAIGHIPIDVRKMEIDLMSASAHKFNGPKGIGFLFKRNGIALHPLIWGGSQEMGLRAGTENVPAIVGMSVALKENMDNICRNTEHLRRLETLFLSMMSEKGVDFLRNGTNHLPGNLNISFKGQSGEAMLHRLDLKGIYVSTGSACDSVNTRVSHVLKAIQLDEVYAKGTIRISLGKENTTEDVMSIVSAIASITKMPL